MISLSSWRRGRCNLFHTFSLPSVVCVGIFIPINYFQWCLFRFLQMRTYKREQKSMQMLLYLDMVACFSVCAWFANNQLVIPNIFPAHREKFERNILFVMHVQTPNDKQWVSPPLGAQKDNVCTCGWLCQTETRARGDSYSEAAAWLPGSLLITGTNRSVWQPRSWDHSDFTCFAVTCKSCCQTVTASWSKA